ncbi:WhiB family transcriptional regulator [Streptomyces sp. NPDC057686]|uniref:WhiB family transcriptional regulator n=1 Tax=Streptomyces sp. NPDC057686 TaxID=3346212 RepID=UPI0036C64F2C
MSRLVSPSRDALNLRIRIPQTEVPTACRSNPTWFSHDAVSNAEAKEEVEKARQACVACPIVTSCLKYALANPSLAAVGVWGTTTPRQRILMRRAFEEEHGPNWVHAIAGAETLWEILGGSSLVTPRRYPRKAILGAHPGPFH